MSKNAPDTRNKLDNNRQAKKKSVSSKKPERKINSREDLLIVLAKEAQPLKLKGEKKPSKGSLFKTANGYSKTMKRNLQKHNLDTVQGYIVAVRKPRKLAEKKARQKKHAEKSAYKRVNGKGKTKKGQAQPKKEKK